MASGNTKSAKQPHALKNRRYISKTSPCPDSAGQRPSSARFRGLGDAIRRASVTLPSRHFLDFYVGMPQQVGPFETLLAAFHAWDELWAPLDGAAGECGGVVQRQA